MTNASTDWIDEAAALPIAFAQVREDPELDREVVRRLARSARVMMVASGGCTAALLATVPSIAFLELVDPNPAQLALTRLKLRLLARHEPAERAALVGRAPMDERLRRERLAIELDALGRAADALGPRDVVARLGPDHAGRYELLFAALRAALSGERGAIASLLALDRPDEQSRAVAPESALGRRIDAAFDEVLALAVLVRLFGAEATRNAAMPFARHFAARLRAVLATLPARANPWLWQMLAGRDPAACGAPWLALPSSAFASPEVVETNRPMLDALRAAPASSFDFVHLSNILDWLDADTAAATLDAAARALRPGGFTLIRQLNSTLEIPRLGPAFEWLAADGERLLLRDRSFFYRALHLGRRR